MFRFFFVGLVGDSKDGVREKAEDLILKLMEWCVQPQVLWERLFPAFNHRSNRVREEIHKILITTLNASVLLSLSLSFSLSFSLFFLYIGNHFI